jgi:hypothetical protein
MHDYTGPSYPLSREEFVHALRVGLGRTRVHAEKFGVCQLRDDILEAATVCKTYDPQVEGLPAPWLAELCVEADIVDEIIARSPAGTDWGGRIRRRSPSERQWRH